MLTPKDSMMAPTATCAVAISAALLLQMVQAPSAIWQATRQTHKLDKLRSERDWRHVARTRNQNVIISDRDDQSEKPMRHLQPDLKRGHIR